MFDSQNISKLGELELALYKYIVENLDKVAYMKIRELASEAHVSTTSILRFCKHMGCEGFSDFKVKLKLYIKEKKERTVNVSFDHPVIEEFMEGVLKRELNKDIEQAAQMIAGFNNVLFVGIGNSGFIAGYGARYLSSLGKFAMHISDPYFPLLGDRVSNSVTIALSISGKTDSILRLVNILKQKGSKIISITNKKGCPLSKLSDFNIAYYITQETYEDCELEYKDITSQIPAVYVVETLSKGVCKYIEK
ncbi:MAG: MurR/RpiR family transcriptional regulator [Thermotaleaceae bacterium]